MFNTSNYHAGNTNVKINAVTGAILKNHPKSWFERFNLKSPRAERLLCEGGDRGPYANFRHDGSRAITVLQMIVCGDMEVMAECVYTKDYEMKEE